jgi:hypothetical protein
MVDPATKERIVDLLSIAVEAGFTPGTPVIGLRLTTRWFASENYAIGPDVLQSLMPSLWDYSGSLDLAIHNLQNDSSTFEWNRAWVLIEDQARLDEAGIKNLSSYLERKSGLAFPDDYLLIGQPEGLDTYRPTPTPSD